MSLDSTDIDPDIMGGARAADADANETGKNVAAGLAKNATVNANAEATELIKEFQRVWGPHYAALQNERLKKVNELAAQDKYKISLQVPSQNKFVNPLTGKEEFEMKDEWEEKTFKRQKLNQSYWIAIEEMKAELAETEDRIEKVKLYNKIQESQAYLYLGMTPEQFRRCDWEYMQMVLLGCTHRTRHGLPNSASASSTSSTQAAVG